MVPQIMKADWSFITMATGAMFVMTVLIQRLPLLCVECLGFQGINLSYVLLYLLF